MVYFYTNLYLLQRNLFLHQQFLFYFITIHHLILYCFHHITITTTNGLSSVASNGTSSSVTTKGIHHQLQWRFIICCNYYIFFYDIFFWKIHDTFFRFADICIIKTILCHIVHDSTHSVKILDNNDHH